MEEIFLKKLLRKKYFFAMIYMLAQIITKKTSNYCRLLILRYLLQMEVYSPLYILHLHFLGQMKILHYLLVWLYQSLVGIFPDGLGKNLCETSEKCFPLHREQDKTLAKGLVKTKE